MNLSKRVKEELRSVDIGDLILIPKEPEMFGYVLRRWEDEDQKNLVWVLIDWKSKDKDFCVSHEYTEEEALSECFCGAWEIRKAKRS